MVLVTVVGELQCRKGFEFVFGGPIAECRDCRVKTICFHLDENRWYRVTDIRTVHHDCKVHEGGVRVVEVERVPTRSAVQSRVAVEGTVIAFEASDCDMVSCPNYRLCHPAGATGGMRFKIMSVVPGEIECPRGKSLRAAYLE